MTPLKKLLEEIWEHRPVLYPCNLVWWNKNHVGHRMVGELEDPLFTAKGKRLSIKNEAREQQKKRLDHE